MSVVFFMTGLMKSESDEANLRIFSGGFFVPSEAAGTES